MRTSGIEMIYLLNVVGIMHLRTRSAAVRHCRDFSLSAYERDLVTNEKGYFRSFISNRTFEDSFFSSLVSIEQYKRLLRIRGELVEFRVLKVTCVLVSQSLTCPISSDVIINAKSSEKSMLSVYNSF